MSDSAIRQFWAAFLESRVERDGDVPGFADWWAGATEWARKTAGRYCSRAVLSGGGEDEIGVAVVGLRAALRFPPTEQRSDHAYGLFRLQVIQDIFSKGLKPIDVAQILESAADKFPQITYEECRRYREMNDIWQPWVGPQLPLERVAQIRAGNLATPPLSARLATITPEHAPAAKPHHDRPSTGNLGVFDQDDDE